MEVVVVGAGAFGASPARGLARAGQTGTLLRPFRPRHPPARPGGDDLAFVLLEPEAGVLRAQRCVRALARQAQAHGATVVRGRARPDGASAVVEDSTRLEGDAVVWACGAWLAALFPALVSLKVTV